MCSLKYDPGEGDRERQNRPIELQQTDLLKLNNMLCIHMLCLVQVTRLFPQEIPRVPDVHNWYRHLFLSWHKM